MINSRDFNRVKTIRFFFFFPRINKYLIKRSIEIISHIEMGVDIENIGK